MSLTADKRMKLQTVVGLLTVLLLMASLGIVQNNKAFAASNTLFKEKFRDNIAAAQKTIKEGSITTNVGVQAFVNIAGNTQGCVTITKIDESTNTYLTDFEACGPAQLKIGPGLSSATFSATVTGFDFASGEDKTVTFNAQLSATGKVETTTFGFRTVTREFTQVFHSNGMIRTASGSVTVSGELIFSTDDATGIIEKARGGQIVIQKS